MNFFENVLKRFNTQKPDLEFIDSSACTYSRVPIKLAKYTQTHFRNVQQGTENKKYEFPECPGMWDYSTMGYILPAWSRMYIKANKAGVIAGIGGGGERRGTPYNQPGKMSTSIVEGIFDLQDGIPLTPYRFDCPWKVYARKNISALLLPAFYHSKFLDDLYVYSGIVNYNKGLSGFNTMNFIVAAKRKCEVIIEPGDPLLHIIPLPNIPVIAEYGPGTKEQSDGWRYIPQMHMPSFYRKLFMGRRKYKLEKNSKTENVVKSQED